MKQPTERTMNHFKAAGGHYFVTEKWNAFAGPIIQKTDLNGVVYHSNLGRRQDMFGFIDLIVLSPTTDAGLFAPSVMKYEIIGIQACAYASISARRHKIVEECQEKAEAWLNSGARIEIWGWKKYDKAIERKFWRPRIVEITMNELNPVDLKF